MGGFDEKKSGCGEKDEDKNFDEHDDELRTAHNFRAEGIHESEQYDGSDGERFYEN